MNASEKKLIIFDGDNILERIGEKRFVKFLDEEQKHAIFYMPLIAPKYFDNYLKENKIVTAYEVTDEKVLEKHSDKIYTFTNNQGVYDVNKGIELENKLILLVDKGMDINVNLPIYSYVVVGNSFVVKPLKERPRNKEYCYVASEECVNPELRKIMINTYEAIPGVLRMEDYPFKCSVKTKEYKPK